MLIEYIMIFDIIDQALQQQNGVDCGVFVIQFVKQILKTTMTSTEEDIKNSFLNFFGDFIFAEADADIARAEFAEEIYDLTNAYRNYKDAEGEKKDKRRLDKLRAAEESSVVKPQISTEQDSNDDLTDEDGGEPMEIIIEDNSREEERLGTTLFNNPTSNDNIPIDSRILKKGYEDIQL